MPCGLTGSLTLPALALRSRSVYHHLIVLAFDFWSLSRFKLFTRHRGISQVQSNLELRSGPIRSYKGHPAVLESCEVIPHDVEDSIKVITHSDLTKESLADTYTSLISKILPSSG